MRRPSFARWMIPEIAREGTVFGMQIDPLHIPESVSNGDWELSGDYIRVAQTIHVEDEIARFKGPVWLIHGDSDEAVPYQCALDALKLYEKAELVTVKDANHCFDDHLDEMADAICHFFRNE